MSSPHPLPDKPGQWCCPLCRSEKFVCVVATKPDGSFRRTSLFQCDGCSVVFTDPKQFMEQRRKIMVKLQSYDLYSSQWEDNEDPEVIRFKNRRM
jgi:hypothetical protein